MSGPIFGNTSALGGSSGGNRHLVEFRAGRMNMVGKMVHPDTRKGLVYMYQAEDGLIHFCWKDRTTGNIEDDLIIFPDDCEFKKIDQCKTGRVYLLKFKSSSRKLFFWLQEPKTDKDDEWCRRVNEVMNNPPSMNSVGSGGRSGSGTDGGDLQYMLNNMSQQQLMQLFGGVGQMGGLSSLLGSMNRPSSGGNSSSPRLSSITTPSRTTAATTATSNTPSVTTTPATTVQTPTAPNPTQAATPQAPKRQTRSGTKDSTSGSSTTQTGSSTDTPRVLLTELQNYLSGLNPTGSNSRRNVDLATGINSEAVESVLSDPNFVTALQNHLPNIESVTDNKPTTGDSKTQLKQTLTSPQFQQALSMFSSALQSGQLGPVVSQFQFSPEVVAAANSGDLEQFVKALEKTVKKSDETSSDAKTESSTEAKKDESKNDEDEPMN